MFRSPPRQSSPPPQGPDGRLGPKSTRLKAGFGRRTSSAVRFGKHFSAPQLPGGIRLLGREKRSDHGSLWSAELALTPCATRPRRPPLEAVAAGPPNRI